MMIHIKRSYLLFVGLFVAALPLWATSEAVFDKIEKEITLHQDGSVTARYQKELVLKTHLAFNRMYGETFVVYNPEFQSLKVNKSYTKQKDGTLIQAPFNAFNEVLPRFAADAPAYNHLREMVITHTGLEIGATIYLDYTITTKAGALRMTDIFETIQEQSPVKECKVTISLPTYKKLHYEVTASDIQPSVTESGKMKSYVWQFNDVPTWTEEPYVPMTARICLYASTVDGFTRIKGMTDALLRAPQAVDDVVQRVVKGQMTNSAKSAAIRQFVVEEIGLVDIPWALSGTVRPVKEILSSAYGTVPERALLFASMLEAAGIKSEFGFVFKGNSKIPTLNNLSGLLVRTNEGWLSAENMLPVEEVIARTHGKLLTLGSRSIVPVELTNTFVVVDRQMSIRMSDTAVVVKEQAKPKEEVSTKVKESVTPVVFRSGVFIYTPEQSEKGAGKWGLAKLNSLRTLPLEIPCKIKESYRYNIQLDHGISLKSLPFRKQLIYPFGRVILTLEYEGEKVVMRRQLELSQTVIQPQQYEAFRKLMQLWYNDAYRTLVVEKSLP